MKKQMNQWMARLYDVKGRFTPTALIGLSAGTSAAALALMLSLHSLPSAQLIAGEEAFASYNAAPSNTETPNVRAALIEAWQNLEREEPLIVEAEQSAAEPEVIVESIYPKEETIAVKVKSGDTLAEILQRHQIGIDDTNSIIRSMKKHFDPRDLRVGQRFDLHITQLSEEKALLNKLEIKTGKLSRVEVLANAEGNSFTAEKVTVSTERQLAKAGGVITSSFYETGDDAGLPAQIIVELMKAYSYDVDFQRDIQPGQSIDVLFEQLISKETGEVVGHGDVKYAAFTLKKKPIEIFKYTDRNGDTGYYKPNGESVRKALLKTPVNARISSRFGMRKHPILGYSKMHTGIDFAAPTGTPIVAAGDGLVDYAARKGGYGKFIRIKHNGAYQTAYAHLSKFARGIRKGRRVKQGQVIGYVGSTGRSTGPHLHYEILKNGKHINPRGAKFRTGRKLKGKELAAFKKEQDKLKGQFAEMPRLREQVAQAELD